MRVWLWAGAAGFWVVAGAMWRLGGVSATDAVLVAVLVAVLPALAFAQRPLAAAHPLERLPVYWSSIGTLWLLGSGCWLVGTRARGPAAVGAVGLPVDALLLWTLAMTGVGVLLLIVFRQGAHRLGVAETRLLTELIPTNGRERRVFVLLSIAAGLAEEVAYRGYLILVLGPITGLGWAVGISTLAFAALHAYQGWFGILRTGTMGGVLAWGLLASGSLWPVAGAHALINLIGGIVLADWLLPRRGDRLSSGPHGPDPHGPDPHGA